MNSPLELIDRVKHTKVLIDGLADEYFDKPKDARYMRLMDSYEKKIKYLRDKLFMLGKSGNIIRIDLTIRCLDGAITKSSMYLTNISMDEIKLLLEIGALFELPAGAELNFIKFTDIQPGKIIS